MRLWIRSSDCLHPHYVPLRGLRKIVPCYFFVCPTLLRGVFSGRVSAVREISLRGCFYILILCDRWEWTHNTDIRYKARGSIWGWLNEGCCIKVGCLLISIIFRGFSHNVVVTSGDFSMCLVTTGFWGVFFGLIFNFRNIKWSFIRLGFSELSLAVMERF